MQLGEKSSEQRHICDDTNRNAIGAETQAQRRRETVLAEKTRTPQRKKWKFNKDFGEKHFALKLALNLEMIGPVRNKYVVANGARSQAFLTSNVLLDVPGSVGAVVEQR